MKKSTNESETPESGTDETANEKPYRPPFLWELFSPEGGLSLLVIFPLVVLFFLKMAYQSV